MSTLLDDSLVIVLAGGAGERLYPLTKERAKPAVYFGGPYRIIDFVLSNCLNSGLRRIYIATQYKSLSLNRHVRMGWSIVSEELGEFVEILPPQKRVSQHWYQGTADAVYQNLYSILQENPRYLVVLAGDHVYKMDYARMLRIHQVQVCAYRFYDENKKASKYWRDIGTLDAYFDANMDLCQVSPEFNLYDPEWPLRTYQPQAPPAKFVFAEAGRRCGQSLDSVISPGCIVSGASIYGSVLCPNVRVHSFSRIEQCILMPGVRVGRHARLRRAIIDRDVLIPRGALI